MTSCQAAGGLPETPLILSRSLGRLLGLERLWFKLEGVQPTGSWLDRGAALVVADTLGTPGLVLVGPDVLGPPLALQAARVGLPMQVLVDASASMTVDLRWSVALGARLARVATDALSLQAAVSVACAASRGNLIGQDDARLRQGLLAAASAALLLASERPIEAIATAGLLGPEGDWLAAGLTVPSVVAGHLAGDDWTATGDDERRIEQTVTVRDADAARRLLAREEGVIASRRGVTGLAALIRALREGRLPKLRSGLVLLANEIGGASDGPPLALDELPVGEALPLDVVRADLRRAVLTPPGYAARAGQPGPPPARGDAATGESVPESHQEGQDAGRRRESGRAGPAGRGAE